MVEAALKRHGHNVSHAARELGLTRAALTFLIDAYDEEVVAAVREVVAAPAILRP